MNSWTTPQCQPLEMNAEIGAYQPDYDDRDPPPVVEVAASGPQPVASETAPA